ncbi:MAG TPA: 3-methyl-2-oxobutanoate hydroxymethyltransferase [Candidatus Udaeobacter sp.]|jgi:3-methyl-2-oxobutanoate hydroxymethyltransferase|nr:3-methyl-2-oxobutanoate hydroxymethyltransferase [Candidatus Udaeobacter sp.]
MNEILLRASFWSAGRPRTTFRRELAFSNRRLIFERSMKDFRQIKQRGDKITALTAYDYPTARLLDESGIDIILVGDSVGMVVLGYPDTADVTLDEMLHHTRAAARGVKQALLVGDMPIHTYDTPQQAVDTARKFVDAGAQAVKLEGGWSECGKIETIVAAGIPVMAHIGMLPQHVREEGGYKMKGKTAREAEQLLDDAKCVERAGAFSVVLEIVIADVARQITKAIGIPTIGIGSGEHCDGQILVTHDLIGLFPWFTPKFVSPEARVAEEIRRAARAFIERTRSGKV